jgi:hypothetical protein
MNIVLFSVSNELLCADLLLIRPEIKQMLFNYAVRLNFNCFNLKFFGTGFTIYYCLILTFSQDHRK